LGFLAADCITAGLAAGDTSQAQLGAWGPNFIEGMNRMRRLVCEYYDGFSFGEFVRRFPHHQGGITDLLIGDLFKPELDQVLQDIDSMKQPDTTAAELA
jgi:hypothetical protein